VPGVECARCVEGGASLETLWQKLDFRAATAGRDVVVLQEDLPETTPDSFRTHVALWIDLCRRHGATPVLYETWAYDRLPTSADTVAAEHDRAAAAHGVRLAPAGRARSAAPEAIELFDDDREHPSLAGTYLAACTIAATIWGPDALAAPKPYRPKNLPAGVAAELRRVALAHARDTEPGETEGDVPAGT